MAVNMDDAFEKIKEVGERNAGVVTTKQIEELRNEEALHRLWNNYAEENSYAAHLKYEDMVDNVLEVGEFIEE